VPGSSEVWFLARNTGSKTYRSANAGSLSKYPRKSCGSSVARPMRVSTGRFHMVLQASQRGRRARHEPLSVCVHAEPAADFIKTPAAARAAPNQAGKRMDAERPTQGLHTNKVLPWSRKR
jgi:hypothetical protein